MRSRLLYAAVAFMATACGGSAGLEEGNAPETLTAYLDNTEESAQGVECGAGVLSAVLTFTDGSAANYVNRVTWRSSDTAVAEISNGDLVAPGGGIYSPGTVLYHRPGKATLTADYLDMTASVAVEVIALDYLEIDPENTRIAPGTTEAFTVKGYTATGYPATNLAVNVSWSFLEDGAPADLATSFTETRASVTALDAPLDAPFVLQAEFPVCDRDVQRSLQISQPDRLTIDSDQGGSSPLPLLLTEGIKVYAEFSNGERQNISSQVDIEQIAGSDDDATLSASGVTGDDTSILLLEPISANETVAYELCQDTIDLCIETETYTLSEIDLESVRAEPYELSLTYPEEAYIKARGDFADGIERDISRIVSYAADSSLVTLQSSASDPGHIYTTNGDGDVQITVSDEDATGTTEDLVDISVYSITP